MNFEATNVFAVGSPVKTTEATFDQILNISVGVVGCPHKDIKVDRLVHYIFSENITAKAAEEGIKTFADAWVEENYPAVQ